jgi:CheY-like chemotaxis protein
LRPPHHGRVQDFDRKVHHKEVAMKAATLTNKCTPAVPGDARAGQRPPLHSPRRRHSVARSLRTYLAEALEIEQQLGKRIRSIEMQPLDALDLGEQRTPAGNAVKRVLLVDADPDAAAVLSALLAPEAQVVHAATLAEAQRSLTSEIFSAVVIDPSLPDGDAAVLLPVLVATPLLVYSVRQPQWRDAAYLPKPWTSPRQLWVTISGMLGLADTLAAGD